MKFNKLLSRDIETKYSIYGDIIHRIYLFPLNEKRFDLEGTTPIFLTVEKERFETRAWNSLIQQLVKYLQKNNPKPIEELLTFHTEWSKATMFANNKQFKNMVEVEDNLFVSINFTAVHSVWFISDILAYYGFNPENIVLAIHRPPKSEPNEVKEFVQTTMIKYFKEYLVTICGRTQEDAVKISNSILSFNKILEKKNTFYNNFYLMHPVYFENYKSKFLNEYIIGMGLDKNKLYTIKKYLNYYSSFIKYLNTNE